MYLKVKRGTYWVEQYGEGEPLLFLHGFTGSTHTWYSVIPYFLKYRIILIDLPGHGKTRDKGITSMQDCCEAIDAILSKLGLKKVHLIGYSMGGRTALSFVRYYPQSVKSLVLESASPGILHANEQVARKKNDQALATFLHEHSIQDFVDKWENIPLFLSQKDLPEKIRHAIREERMAQSSTGLAHSLTTMGTGVMPSLWEHLGKLKCSVLLLVGRRDSKFISINKEMEKQIPRSTLKIVKDAGHAIHVEQLNIFGTIVEDFITQEEVK